MEEFLILPAVIFYGIRAYKLASSLRAPKVRHISLLLAEILVLTIIVAQLTFQDYVQMPFREYIPEKLIYFGAALALLGSLFSSWARMYMNKNWHTGWAEDTPQNLVTSGPFKLMRHPIYLGTWLFGFGFELALWNWLLLGVLAAAFVLGRAAIHEEANLQKQFPEEWRVYAYSTKRFIPYIW